MNSTSEVKELCIGVGAFIVAGVLGFFVLATSGCSELKGGESRHETGATHVVGGESHRHQGITRVEVGTDGDVRIEQMAQSVAATQPSVDTKHDNVSTTQPSVKSGVGQKLKIGSAGEGELGSLTLEAAKQNFPNAWPVGLALLAACVGLAYLHRYFAAVLAGACGLLTLLYPQAMVFALIGVLVYLLWAMRGTIKQLVAGGQNALKSVEPEAAAALKSEMERAHDDTTKRIISAVKKP